MASRSLKTGALSPVVPIAAAIGVFGVIYGTAAGPLLGWPVTLLSSVFVFSGAAQFTMVGLLAGGASPWAVLWAVACLDLRHLVLGATVRSGLAGSTLARRARAAWFLIDETVGLALTTTTTTTGGETDTVLVRAGIACYGAWIGGTALGLAGGAAVGLEGLAAAVFPVLFIGLASIMARGADLAVRTCVAAVLTLLLLLAWPGLEGVAPVIAAVAVSVPRL